MDTVRQSAGEQRSRTDASAWSYAGKHGVVASAHHMATRAGVRMLERGGNAIDAAVATSFALAVCEPAGSGLGGMAVAVVHLAGQDAPFTVEGSCRAPRAATPERVSNSHRYRGHRAVAVPMHPAVMHHLLSTFGTLSPAQVLEPAIALAREGYALSTTQQELTQHYLITLRSRSAASLFLGKDRKPLPAGATFRQPALAKTLERLASTGIEDFYLGYIAKQIGQNMRENGGFLDEGDLAAVGAPRQQTPVTTAFRGGTVHTLGPPGGGLTLIQMIQLANALGIETFDPSAPGSVDAAAAIIRQARRDRTKFRLELDPDNPDKWVNVLDCERVDRVGTQIKRELGLGETSHFCVMDASGNAVSVTQSIERSFGSAEACAELGFLYNGFLRAFKVENKKHPHFLRPGAVARSNASPTIVLRDGQVQTVVGATGSERGVSVIFTTLLRLGHCSPFEAVAGPRLHTTPNGNVLIEAERFPTSARQILTDRGYVLSDVGSYSFKMGGVQLITRTESAYCGVADPRRDGLALGPTSAPPQHFCR